MEIGAPAIGQRHQLHAQRRDAERQDELGAERQPLVPGRGIAGQQQVLRRYLKALREHHQCRDHQQREAREAGRDQQQRDLDQQAEDIDPLQRVAVRQHAADELRAAGEQVDQRHQPADAQRSFPHQPGHPLAEPLGHRGHGGLEDQPGADHRHRQHDEGADRIAPVGADPWLQVARPVGDHARRDQPQQDQSGTETNRSRNDEGRPPVYQFSQAAGDQGGAGNALSCRRCP